MVRLLLTILSFGVYVVSAQTSLTFSEYTADKIRPGAGATLWNNEGNPYGTMHIPVSGSPQVPRDYYWRFYMTDFFADKNSVSDSSYDFSFYREKMEAAISQRQGFRFRIMPVCDCDFEGNNGMANYDGYNAVYPRFLHELMQDETFTDWASEDMEQWIPNWNSVQFARWAGKLLSAIRSYNDTATYNGYSFADALRIFDLSFYGNYGEQHSVGIVANAGTDYPTGTGPTAAGLDSLASKQLQAMEGYKIVVPFGAFDAEFLDVIWNPPAYAEWLLNHKDSIGWINDHLSSDEGYDHAYLEDNDRINGTAYAQLMNRWKHTPIGGEPPGGIGSPADLAWLPEQVETYHMSFFGNGNYGGYTNANTTAANNARLASKTAGYRLRPVSGSMTTTPQTGENFNIKLDWINDGVAPAYEQWNVVYELQTSGGTVLQSWTSSFDPQYFQPSGSSTEYDETFALAESVAPGVNYRMVVRIQDPSGYYRPMPLFITTTELADGGYPIRTGITVEEGAGGGNAAPVADAGPNQTITLPIDDVSVSGSSSTDDVAITSWAWTKISGPATYTIVSPTSENTDITGLVEGTYVFRLTVGDGEFTDTDDITITVNPEGAAAPNGFRTRRRIRFQN